MRFARWLGRRPAGRLWPPLLAGLILAGWWWCLLPSPLFHSPYSTVLLDREGRLLGASRAADDQWRFAPGPAVPTKFLQALVHFEDKRFFQHWGVDALALGRALRLNLAAGDTVSGGSTLSMQVIRLARGNPDRNLVEKAWEALLALRLELTASKTDILRLFASHAPFGGNVVGLEAAAWRYFNRAPENLSWAEAAMLAVLPNSPSLVHLGRNRQLLAAKRDRLLERLAADGLLTPSDLHLAKAEPLPPEPYPLPRHAPHLLARATLGLDSHSGQRLTTSLDLDLQDRVATVLATHQAELSGNGIQNLGALILDVDTGQVLAYAGNLDRATVPGHDNDMVQAQRSTGSTLKPILFASMLDAGELLPGQLVTDIPTRIGGFVPENNSKTYAGAVPAWEALAKSLNVPAARELRTFGVDRFYNQLKRVGLSTLFRSSADYGLTLILGGAEGRLWDLTGIYAGLARTAKASRWAGFGSRSPFFAPRWLAKATPPETGPTEAPITPGAAWLTLQAMNEVTRPGDEGSWRDFSSSQHVAWKTGTSFGYRDAWSIGVTARYAVGVWVGNADGEGRPNLLGFTAAAPVMFDLFNLLDQSAWIPAPLDDLKEVEVCRQSGYLAGPDCPDHDRQLIPRAARPTEVCPFHHVLHLDPTEQWQVNSKVEPVANIHNVSWFILPPALEAYYRPRHLEYRSPPPFKPGAEPDDLAANSPLSLIFPEPGGQIFIPVELDLTRGRTVLQAAHRNPQATLFWHLDGQFLGSTVEIHQLEVRPTRGPHTLVIWDEAGHSLTRHFTVLSP